MNNDQTLSQTSSLARSALVTGLYIALTFLVAPIAFGPIQFRISEMLNFLGLYNRRYIYAVTLGVVISNFYTYGLVDMIVGGGSTFVFLWLCRWLAKSVTVGMKDSKIDPMIIQYIVLIIGFSLSMFTIAGMLVLIGAENAFWPVYLSLVLSEVAALTFGAFIMYPISKRTNFHE